MQLFYNPTITPKTSEFVFDKRESLHIVKVLRKSVGDKLHITNGKGFLFAAKIQFTDAKRCVCEIIETTSHNAPLVHLHLAVAPTKMNDRYEWFLEKATEIGVSEITPIICKNSERKVIKKERYEKIIQAAMKQSLQYHLPKLNDSIHFNDFITHPFNGDTFIAHCENTKKIPLKHCIKKNNTTTILIGPEGDFSSNEIEQAMLHHFKPVSLATNRLRTETAAIVACHTVAVMNTENT